MGSEGDRYSDRVLELAYEPLNVGELEDPDGLGYVEGECGDRMWIYLKLAGERIVRAAFLTDGCGATLACGSSVTELVKDKTVGEASSVSVPDIIDYLGDLPPSHHHCAVLAVNTLRKALADIPQHRNKGCTENE